MRTSVLSAALLLTLALGVRADDTVLQVLVSPEPVAGLEEVFYLTAGVELTRAGLTSRRARTSVTDRSGVIDQRRIEASAREADATFVMLLEYERRDSRVTYVLSFHTLPFESAIATRRAESPIDIDLDERFAVVVRELIAEADIGRLRTAETSLEGVDLALRSDGPEVALVAGPELTLVAGPELTVLTSGLFVVGSGSDWFRFGVAASLSGGYVPASRRFGVLLGVRGSVFRLFADEGVEGGELFIVTGGPDVQFGTVYRAPARLALRVSGGAAALVVVRPADTPAKAVPFAEAGVAARVPLGSVFALGAEVSYLVVFEPGLPLMWLSPSITLSMEL